MKGSRPDIVGGPLVKKPNQRSSAGAVKRIIIKSKLQFELLAVQVEYSGAGVWKMVTM